MNIIKRILVTLLICSLVWFIFFLLRMNVNLQADLNTANAEVEETTKAIEEFYVVEEIVNEPIVPIGIIKEVPAQPTALLYQDNWTLLRARAAENKTTFDIPAHVTNVSIAFNLAKHSTYQKIPGNIQAWIGDKKLCNGRLEATDQHMLTEATSYRYDISAVSIQDTYWNPNFDWDRSDAIGKTLTIQSWIWENKNNIESIEISRN